MQDALLALTKYWTDRGCMIAQPYNTEVGAGTANPATFLRVLGPEPWHVAYVEPSVRPDDARYGENPNRLQMHTQFQVILKPEPGDPQELYLGSLQALGIDIAAHDIRFVEDNWAQPTIGAWGLGWEVWLDGLEITQFTYFQQVGGQVLDPVPVELTYGVERILMALQGVSHFKDIVYSPGVTYGEVFGQSEYEMSRYYLDDADVGTNHTLYETYVAEAERLVAARLPVPAYSYVLKCSHAFNVLDARGAISTTERAKAFARMRGLAREVATLWIERRAELGHPLGIGRAAHENEPLLTPVVADSDHDDEAPPAPLVVEIGTEELPPHEVRNTVAAVEAAVRERLGATRLPHGEVRAYGTPRRVVVTVDDVGAREPDAERTVRGPRVSAAYDAEGAPTKALAGFLRGQGIEEDDDSASTAVSTAEFGGNEHVVVTVVDTGRSAEHVLSGLVADVVSGLRAEKNMRWSDGALSFSRPIRWLLVLLGDSVVPVVVSSLASDRRTHVHRTAEQPELTVATAAGYLDFLRSHGIEPDAGVRRRSIVTAVEQLAASVGGMVDVDAESSLVDEITNLVEHPTAILGNFDNRYLELPEQVLTTVMRKHQRYLPVRSRDGRLLPHFVTVANGACDEALVRAGNEAVIRARYEDAAFFWRADLGVPLDEFSAGLTKLTFEERLGSMADRTARIAFIAAELQPAVGLDRDDEKVLARAAALAKFDLASHMVVELSSLAGVMAREYAVRAGEPSAVAQALFEMELPRHTSDQLPTALPGAVLALADRFDLLMAMFALGAKPTGSSDPFGLRRAALGVVRILREFPALSSITVSLGLSAAADQLRVQGVQVAADAVSAAEEFVIGRFAQQLRDEDVPAGWVDAVLPAATAPGRAVTTLTELRGRATDPEFRRLVAALQRISRILPAGVEGVVDRQHLHESAEKRLADTVEDLADFAKGSVGEFAVEAAPLVEPVDAFFTDILVMAEDPALRQARLGLLATILQRSPKSVDWQALDTALG